MLHKNVQLHPGEILKRAYMEPLGISVTELSKMLSVSKASISRLTSCKSSVSVEMAIRLSYCLGTSANSWLSMQANYDIANSIVDETKITKAAKL